MTAVAKIEENYNHIECREDWGDVQDPNSFARRYHAHKLWLKDKNQEGAARFVCKVGEVLPENLTGVDLRKAILETADLEGANLEGANLGGANLKDAHLLRANLEGANLEGANLEGAILGGANLEGANLKNVEIDLVSLKNETKLWNDALLAGAILYDNDEYFTKKTSRKIIKEIAKEHGINARLGSHPALVPAIAASAVGATILALAVAFNNGSAPDEKTSTQPVGNDADIRTICADGGAREHSTVNAVCRKLGL